jgi:hypothetical protein
MIIFSVFQSCYNRDQNEMQHQGMVRWFKRQGIHFKETVGTYQGVEELGFCLCDNLEERVIEHCREFSQECYLVVSKMKAYLVYTNGPLKGKEIFAGVWTPGKGLKGDYTTIDGSPYHCE